MSSTTLHFDWLSPAWRGFWNRLSPRSRHSACIHLQGLWRRWSARSTGILIEGSRYCLERCLECALQEALRRVRAAARHVRAPHRIPLGLLLLSRQQLTVQQLRTALENQRAAGRGRIGEWLQVLGFVNEQQITAALARQWSCPVLRTTSVSSTNNIPQIPATLLESFVMMPVDYVQATSTLHLAFGEGIDYSVLYAIEQMAGCRTEPCMAVASFVRQSLRAAPVDRSESEVVFDRVTDDAEFLRIIRSYSVRIAATEIRLADCGPHLWVRLLRRTQPPLDLLLQTLPAAAASPGLRSARARLL